MLRLPIYILPYAGKFFKMMLNFKHYLKLLILLWISCTSLQTSAFPLVIIPELAFTTTTKVKVSLILDNDLRSGAAVMANCFLEVVGNISDECNMGTLCSKQGQHILLSAIKEGPSAKNSFLTENDGMSTEKFGDSETSDVRSSLISKRLMTTTADHLSTKTPHMASDVDAWTLEYSTFHFTDTVLTQDIIITRSKFPPMPKIEFLRIRCGPSDDSASRVFDSSKYKTSSALIVAELNPPVAVNWTNADVLGSPLNDRLYPNPAYIEVSPCSCDLTSVSCDVNCCCDEDCLMSQLRIFTCMDGLAGGNAIPKVTDYVCKAQATNSTDWFSFLCVVRNSSSYLGFYFVCNPPILRNTKGLKLRVQQMTSRSIWRYPNQRVHRPLESDKYQYGSPILTVVVGDEKQGYLSLPTQALKGQCTEMSPLAFLVSQTSSCNTQVTIESCSKTSLLSATTYLEDSSATDLHVISRMGQKRFANVTVTYQCSGNVDGGLPLFNRDDYTLVTCYPSQIKPFYNLQTGLCENAVLHVRYVFWWNGFEIEAVNVTVVLGNLSVMDSRNQILSEYLFVTQQFEAEFWHSSLQNNSFNSRNETIHGLPSMRSENRGYEIGRTLITGIPQDASGSYSSQLTDFSFMNTDEWSMIRLLKSEYQHGFRKGQICETQLAFFVHYI